MTEFLKQWWQLVTGRDTTAVDAAYSKGYLEGMLKGLEAGQRVKRLPAYLDGFQEGRESVRTIPLDSSVADDEEDMCSLH